MSPSSSVDPDTGDMRALLHAIPQSFLLTDRQGRILLANRRAMERFDLTPDQLGGANLLARLAPHVAERCRRDIPLLHADAAAAERAVEWEAEGADGRDVRYTLAAFPASADAGQRIAFFIEDVTERRHAEDAAHLRDLRYRFIVENAADTFWELDAQLRFTYISAADRRERGFEPEEVIGQSMFSILTPASQERVKLAIAARLAHGDGAAYGGPVRHEVEVLKKDGTMLWAEAHAMPFFDAAGKIEGFRGTSRNITERKRYELALEQANRTLQAQVEEISSLQMRLHEKANRDFLTGLYNRRYLDETLPRELVRARRENYPLSLILIDLDHFKRVNDAYGHAAGDAVLKTLGSILQREARASDLICRYGGEEFLVVLPKLPLAAAQARAETWRATLAATPVAYEQCRIALTLSAGIAIYPDNGANMECLLRMADEALYRAKHEGRNRIDAIDPGEQLEERRHPILSLIWKPPYACGHPLIDAEHRELFQLANGLLDLALDEEATPDRFGQSFDALLEHVAAHFTHEEAILASRGYERLEEHAGEHRRLVERAVELRRQTERHAASIGALVDFLVEDVVVRHMLKADRNFYFLFQQ